MGNLIGIRQRRRRYMQEGFQTVQRVGLEQRVGRGGEVVDVVRQHLTVLGEEGAKCGDQTVELLYGVGQVPVRAGQAVGELDQVFVERHELLVVGVQCVDNQPQAAPPGKEAAAALVDRGHRPQKASSVVLNCLPLPASP